MSLNVTQGLQRIDRGIYHTHYWNHMFDQLYRHQPVKLHHLSNDRQFCVMCHVYCKCLMTANNAKTYNTTLEQQFISDAKSYGGVVDSVLKGDDTPLSAER